MEQELTRQENEDKFTFRGVATSIPMKTPMLATVNMCHIMVSPIFSPNHAQKLYLFGWRTDILTDSYPVDSLCITRRGTIHGTAGICCTTRASSGSTSGFICILQDVFIIGIT